MAGAASALSHLLRRLPNVLREAIDERVVLEVRPLNPSAKALYASVGLGLIGPRPRYYPARGGREDALVMELVLSSGE